jgi:hypothetical protein
MLIQGEIMKKRAEDFGKVIERERQERDRHRELVLETAKHYNKVIAKMDRIIYTGEIMLYVLCFMIGVMIATAIFG